MRPENICIIKGCKENAVLFEEKDSITPNFRICKYHSTPPYDFLQAFTTRRSQWELEQ